MGSPCPAGDHASRCGVAVLWPWLPVFMGRRAGELGLRRAGHDLARRSGRLAASPLLPDPPPRPVGLRRCGVGLEAPFSHRGVALHTGDLPPRQEALLRARRDNGGALRRGALAHRLLQSGGPPLRDADPALHPGLLLLVGPYARSSLPRGTPGERGRMLHCLRRTLRLHTLLRTAPGDVAGRRPGRAGPG
jgi:hypothetical protein